MIQSDALSWRLDYILDKDNDNEDITMLPDDLFINLIDLDLQKCITNCNDMDWDATKALMLLLEQKPATLKNNLVDWTLEKINDKNVLFFKGKNYIPRDNNLQWDITKMFHDHEMAGHPGELEMLNSIWQHYWWHGLRTFVKNYVKGCGVCQQFKIDQSPSKLAFQPTKGAKSTHPFANCSMDLITDLLPVNGFDSILVVVDQGLTKGVILIPCNKMITAEGMAQLLLKNLYKRFGLPDKIISDWGPQFALKAFVELLKLLGIKLVLSTAYHLQTDRTTKQVNQEIEAYLAIYCASHPEEWVTALSTLEFTHNNWRHTKRQKTPFKLMFRDSPVAVSYSFKNTKFPTIEDKMRTLIKNHEEALAAHELAHTHTMEHQRTTFTPFKKGNQVWLDLRNLKTMYHKKMAPKQEGLFMVTEVIRPVTYRLKLPATWKIHNVFHATLLQQYKENKVYRVNFLMPPPELDDREEIYEVESILRHWRQGRGYQYYVKWKGYPISEALWEPEHVFSDDGDLLTHYKEQHQLWNHHSCCIMDFPEQLSLLDYYLAKLERRFNLLFNQIWEIYDKLGDIKEVLEYNGSPRPPHEFDPLQTVWKKTKMSQSMHDTTLATGVQPPAPQPTSPPHDTLMLSPGELTIMFQTKDFSHQIALAFNNDPTTFMTLQHWNSGAWPLGHVPL